MVRVRGFHYLANCGKGKVKLLIVLSSFNLVVCAHFLRILVFRLNWFGVCNELLYNLF
ncbi:hypothetical protein V6Z12_D10G187900 [Gossypium hirsutum]